MPTFRHRQRARRPAQARRRALRGRDEQRHQRHHGAGRERGDERAAAQGAELLRVMRGPPGIDGSAARVMEGTGGRERIASRSNGVAGVRKTAARLGRVRSPRALDEERSRIHLMPQSRASPTWNLGYQVKPSPPSRCSGDVMPPLCDRAADHRVCGGAVAIVALVRGESRPSHPRSVHLTDIGAAQLGGSRSIIAAASTPPQFLVRISSSVRERIAAK